METCRIVNFFELHNPKNVWCQENYLFSAHLEGKYNLYDTYVVKFGDMLYNIFDVEDNNCLLVNINNMLTLDYHILNVGKIPLNEVKKVVDDLNRKLSNGILNVCTSEHGDYYVEKIAYKK